MPARTNSGCLIVLLAFIVDAFAEVSLLLQLAGPSSTTDVQNLNVVATITNNGAEALKILNDPRGPLSNLPTDIFAITNSHGLSPSFVGIAVKYVPRVAASSNDSMDCTFLGPGQSHKVEHNLSLAYDFSTSGPGQYTISLKNSDILFDVSQGRVLAILANGGSVKRVINVSGTHLASRSRPSHTSEDEKCEDWQHKEIHRALPITKRYIADALAHLTCKGDTGDHYKRWFGSPSEHRFATVASHFESLIANNFTDFTFACNTKLCSRRAGLYAYTYPDEFGKIYLCGTFFRAPVGGPDSRASTIVHESSHFTRNGGTLDHAYGQTLSRALARSYPHLAVMNADNHEYFAAVASDDDSGEGSQGADPPVAQTYLG